MYSDITQKKKKEFAFKQMMELKNHSFDVSIDAAPESLTQTWN